MKDKHADVNFDEDTETTIRAQFEERPTNRSHRI